MAAHQITPARVHLVSYRHPPAIYTMQGGYRPLMGIIRVSEDLQCLGPSAACKVPCLGPALCLLNPRQEATYSIRTPGLHVYVPSSADQDERWQRGSGGEEAVGKQLTRF